ncbi:MAG TPA: hypothetical protein ENH46_06880 [Candidatus Pacearchaeota archaeon]|nr:hypothetical protein [Candidatus Pacearchaeota archaeon]
MKIKSIKKIGKRKTWDIQVENHPSFFLSNGILSHNSEVKGMIEGSEDLLFVSEMPSPSSREVTCAPLVKDKRMSPAQVSYISWKIKIHEVCVVERGRRAIILKRINPPRSKYWKAEYGDFNTHWKNQVDKWMSSNNFIDEIKTEYADREELNQLDTIEKEEDEEEIKKEEEIKEITNLQIPKKINEKKVIPNDGTTPVAQFE